MLFRNVTSGGVGEIIREAERLIAGRRYELALVQLERARQSEPKNAYITAIIERVHMLLTQDESSPAAPEKASEIESHRLSVTVGPEHENGIRPREFEELGSAADREDRVKRLTGVALDLFRHGSYDTAFDSLMKAYLLDPTSRYVIECERVLAPAIELIRKRASSAGVPVPHEVPPSPAEPDNTASPVSVRQRLENLLKQKEVERQEHERDVWLRASHAPGNRRVQPGRNSGVASGRSPSQQLPPAADGLLSKLKQGKFLD